MRGAVASTLLALAMPAFGLVTETIHIANHGGWTLWASVGADEGDRISFDVQCDHNKNGECLIAPPHLTTGIPFKLTSSSFEHQHYELIVPVMGNQIINADYWWVGTDVHYEIVISAEEKQ